MGNATRGIGPSFLALGLVFVAIGFVQQEFAITFESGMFNLGVIFTLSGAVATALDRRSHRD